MTEDWEPSEGTLTGLFERGFTEHELRRELELFRNHWISVPGKDGLKIDWDRTFINRMLNLRKYANDRRN